MIWIPKCLRPRRNHKKIVPWAQSQFTPTDSVANLRALLPDSTLNTERLDRMAMMHNLTSEAFLNRLLDTHQWATDLYRSGGRLIAEQSDKSKWEVVLDVV